MRYCYAHRRFTLYPDALNSWDLTPDAYSPAFLTRVKDMGFDAVEVGSEVLERAGATERSVKDLAKKFGDHGLKIGALRSGGTLLDAKNGLKNREKQLNTIKYAGWAGAEEIGRAHV